MEHFSASGEPIYPYTLEKILLEAIFRGDIIAIKICLEKNRKLINKVFNVQDEDSGMSLNMTPLHFALALKNKPDNVLEVVVMLLELGADTSYPEKSKRHPVKICLIWNNEISKILRDHIEEKSLREISLEENTEEMMESFTLLDPPIERRRKRDIILGFFTGN